MKKYHLSYLNFFSYICIGIIFIVFSFINYFLVNKSGMKHISVSLFGLLIGIFLFSMPFLNCVILTKNKFKSKTYLWNIICEYNKLLSIQKSFPPGSLVMFYDKKGHILPIYIFSVNKKYEFIWELLKKNPEIVVYEDLQKGMIKRFGDDYYAKAREIFEEKKLN